MIQLKIDGELETIVNDIAARTGDTPDDLARKALLAYLEDLEDYALAVEAWRQSDPRDTISLEEVMARYGVESEVDSPRREAA